MKRRIVWWALTIACAVLILTFSCQSGLQSGELSNSLTQSVLEQVLAYQKMTPAEQAVVFAKVYHLLREIAHVVTFMALGFSASMLARSYAIRRWIMVVFSSCVTFAVLDESVQHFLKAGRTFQFVDLLKDWAGALLGIVIVALIGQIIRQNYQEESSDGVSSSGA